jgi:hypothetical protein
MSHTAEALTFPFVENLPKRQRSKIATLWDQVEELARIQQEVGPVAPQILVSKVLGVSRARVCNLIDSGVLEAVDFHGNRMITKRSLEAYAKAERLKGRPLGKVSLPEMMRMAWESAHEEKS